MRKAIGACVTPQIRRRRGLVRDKWKILFPVALTLRLVLRIKFPRGRHGNGFDQFWILGPGLIPRISPGNNPIGCALKQIVAKRRAILPKPADDGSSGQLRMIRLFRRRTQIVQENPHISQGMPELGAIITFVVKPKVIFKRRGNRDQCKSPKIRQLTRILAVKDITDEDAANRLFIRRQIKVDAIVDFTELGPCGRVVEAINRKPARRKFRVVRKGRDNTNANGREYKS